MQLRHGAIGAYGIDPQELIDEVRERYGRATSATLLQHGVLPVLEADLAASERRSEQLRVFRELFRPDAD